MPLNHHTLWIFKPDKHQILLPEPRHIGSKPQPLLSDNLVNSWRAQLDILPRLRAYLQLRQQLINRPYLQPVHFSTVVPLLLQYNY